MSGSEVDGELTRAVDARTIGEAAPSGMNAEPRGAPGGSQSTRRPRAALDPEALERSFAALAPLRAALRADELPRLNFHPGQAAAFVLDVVASLAPHYAAIHAHTSLAPADLERLEDAARAVLWAQHHLVAERAATATDRRDDGAELVAEAMALRTRLASLARELRAWEVIPADAVVEVGRTKAALADDLAALEALYRRHWAAIDGNAPVREATLDRAAELFGLVNRVITRPAPPRYARSVRELADERLRATAVLVRLYEKLRGAVTYVRAGEGDADDLAPSLYRVHTEKRRRRASSAPVGGGAARHARGEEAGLAAREGAADGVTAAGPRVPSGLRRTRRESGVLDLLPAVGRAEGGAGDLFVDRALGRHHKDLGGG